MVYSLFLTNPMYTSLCFDNFLCKSNACRWLFTSTKYALEHFGKFYFISRAHLWFLACPTPCTLENALTICIQ